MLKRAIILDKTDRYKIKWIEYAAQIKYLERKAKQFENSHEELIIQLKKLQVSIQNISRHKFNRDQQAQAFSRKRSSRRQEKREKGNTNPDHTSDEESQNYYEILGVPENASDSEIKTAFRRKMKEYHPDKHSASDFGWIKEEAARMTKLVQEAYQVLSDPQKRKSYTP